MVRQFATAVILAATLTLIGTHAAANDYRQHSWGVSISVGHPGGYRHHSGYQPYRAYPAYRWRTNFYGPNRNFYDNDGRYSYRDHLYSGDRSYDYGRPGQYRHKGGFYRYHPPDGRRHGRGRH